MLKKYLLALALMFSSSLTLFAQRGIESIIYLKNGSILRGKIIEEVLDKEMKIRTRDGNFFVVRYEDILKIVTDEHNKNTNIDSKRGYIGLSLGYSGAKGLDSSGDRQSGAQVLIDFGFLFGEHWGISAKSFSNYIGGSSDGNISGLMLGPMWSTRLNDALRFELKPLMGYAIYDSQISSSLGGSSFPSLFGNSYSYYSDLSTAFALGLDTSLRFHLSRGLDFIGTASIMSAGDVNNIGFTIGLGIRLR